LKTYSHRIELPRNDLLQRLLHKGAANFSKKKKTGAISMASCADKTP